ncbi:MAG: shikimate kinase AroK [Gammaproteobacteria bacterium]|nr:shikimate kinase AroK [Gammaproteobacteria bacterium]
MKGATNVFLVGPMGAGKSTIGRHLARVLGQRFVDADREIEARTGASISLIFDLEGEAGFRRRESAVIAELAASDGLVVATGGGAVLDPANRAALRQRGTVVYLHAPLEVLVRRTHRDRDRPLLQTADPRASLERIVLDRDPLYREVADLVIETDHRSVPSVVSEVARRLSAL